MARVALLDEAVGDRMAGVAGPEARRAFMHRPAMADAIGRFNEAVADSQLPLRLHEIVRYRIAQINGCARCQAYRTPGAGEAGADEATLERVEGWRGNDTFEEVERLALDYAERFSLTPQAINDELVAALRRQLGDAQLVDLTICIAKYVAMGRLITALDLDQTCVIVRGGSVASAAS
jgi:AhpD family alkylhydroperoxidase